jgi:hypothetical protein
LQLERSDTGAHWLVEQGEDRGKGEDDIMVRILRNIRFDQLNEYDERTRRSWLENLGAVLAVVGILTACYALLMVTPS